MEKKKNTPKLRFPEFTGEWEEKKLREIANISSGGTPNRSNSRYWNGNIAWITTSLINFNVIYKAEEYITDEGLQNSSAKLFPSGTLLMAMYGQGVTRGKVSILGIEASCNQACCAIVPKKNLYDKLFIFQNLFYRYDEIRNLSNQGGQQNLSGEIIKNIPIKLAAYSEQTKIATFLTAVDEKLTQLKKKKTLLEQYKKGVMQKLFSQELRFKDDNNQDFPDWQEKTLGEISNRVITKNKENNLNVLTISAQNGLVSQLEFFNKSVSAKDVTGYYLLDRNDFAYNKSYSNGYPMGAIKRLTRYEKGVVSTLYICFRNKTCFDNSFAEQYFETGLQNNELEKVAQEGARNHGLLNIGVSDFFKIELTIPSLPEQQKIATFLSAIDEKINYCSAQIEKMEAWKKGLLQQMFC